MKFLLSTFVVVVVVLFGDTSAFLKAPMAEKQLEPGQAPVPDPVAPVAKCFEDCANMYAPEPKKNSYAACRHGCRFAQYSLYSPSADSDASPYHKCYKYCQSSYKDDLAHQEACIYSCRASYHTSETPLLPQPGRASLPEILYNQSISAACLGQLYSSLEGPRCQAYIQAWQFNYNTMKCEKFIYGGCPEVANMFDTEQLCTQECGSLAAAHAAHHHHTSASQNRDSQPPKCLSPTYNQYLQMGGLDCDNFVPKYQFNFELGECEPFQFGGCLVVDNMFDSLADCATECAPFTPPPTTTTTTTTTEAPTTAYYRVESNQPGKGSKSHSYKSSASLAAVMMGLLCTVLML